MLTWQSGRPRLHLPINLNDPNSATITITGTIENTVAKMDTDYPGWNATFMARDPHPSDGDRDDEEPLQNGTFNCRPDHEGWANRGAIRDGIQYLRKVPGTAKTELGPTTAANDVEKELEWNDIADAARDITYKCWFNVNVNVMRRHVDYDDKWEVIVRKEHFSVLKYCEEHLDIGGN
ncbi:hypothetical protein QC763_0091770 [Podospora pseudopauciseta]|uniref:Uncharacterized protein n=1 Tax=Podospora pseudopauciseta TaxID=2093780 RepID=A0ABR0H4E8_9PEZI|nr:hypothetical protein QC763_0091770 [Podospora pseudopauciseta]